MLSLLEVEAGATSEGWPFELSSLMYWQETKLVLLALNKFLNCLLYRWTDFAILPNNVRKFAYSPPRQKNKKQKNKKTKKTNKTNKQKRRKEKKNKKTKTVI